MDSAGPCVANPDLCPLCLPDIDPLPVSGQERPELHIELALHRRCQRVVRAARRPPRPRPGRSQHARARLDPPARLDLTPAALAQIPGQQVVERPHYSPGCDRIASSAPPSARTIAAPTPAAQTR